MKRIASIIFILMLLPAAALADGPFPPPDFRSGYTMPNSTSQLPVPRAEVWGYVDVVALATALTLAAWLVLKKRSRRGVFLLMIASLIYFGFWRKGCVCSIGSIQNVAYAIGNPQYVLPWVVAAYFLLPLAFTLFFGRVFCSGVCPLGAIQDAVLWKPIQFPAAVEAGLGLFAYGYLGLAVLLAATGSEFAICQYDPFVGFFRLSGPAHMIFLGVVLLGMGMFVGRIYCRFICPYSVLLKILAPFAKWRVSITPKECINCRLCEHSCPFGAIRTPATQGAPVRPVDRVRLVLAVLLVIALPLALAWLGHRVGPQMAQIDPVVTLAQAVQKTPPGPPSGPMKDQITAFRASDQTPAQLYEQAAGIQARFVIGTAWLGAWIGVVVAFKLLARSVRRRQPSYAADASSCLSCARCYKYCPVDNPAVPMPAMETVVPVQTTSAGGAMP